MRDTTPPQGEADYLHENERIEVMPDGSKQRVTRTGRAIHGGNGQGKRDSFRRSLFDPSNKKPRFQKLNLGGRRK